MGLMGVYTGDEIQKMFLATQQYPLGLVFTYVYSALFIILVANVFLFLIESGYQKGLKEIKKKKIS